jgi:hypothetical protein
LSRERAIFSAGVHAAAYLVNAKIVATPTEEAAMFKNVLSNAVTICSWSPFNQYWILQALGNLNKMVRKTHSTILYFAMPRHLMLKMPSFYQDRLGTHIGKAALKTERRVFL